jgi:hypothetical protein
MIIDQLLAAPIDWVGTGEEKWISRADRISLLQSTVDSVC